VLAAMAVQGQFSAFVDRPGSGRSAPIPAIREGA
jgi:hypothetical protein